MGERLESSREIPESAWERLQETPEYQEAVDAIKERHVTSFLQSVRGADSPEEAMHFAPDTSPSVMTYWMNEEGSRKAEELAEAAREKWAPVLEQVRSAENAEEARQTLGELEDAVGSGSLLEIMGEVERIREQKES